MQLPVAVIGIILAIAIPTYLDYRVRDHVSAELAEKVAPVQQQVITFFQQHHRLPDQGEIEAVKHPVRMGSRGSIQLSLDTIHDELEGSKLELLPGIENRELIWRCLFHGEAKKYIPLNCRKGEVMAPVQPLKPGESATQEGIDWIALVAAIIAGALVFGLFVALVGGLFKLGFYLHWRMKSPTDRLVQYFHGDLDLTKPRVLLDCLAKDADPNARDRHGRSLLYRTAIGCHADHMGPLLEYGADPNFREPGEEDGDSVLTEALRWVECSSDIIERLIKKGADPNARGGDGQTPLSIAISNDQDASVYLVLVDHGADLEARDNEGDTPLMQAAKADIDVEVFILRGADICAINPDGYTALWYAVQHNNQRNMKLLINHGAGLNVSNHAGKNLVMLATRQRNIDTLRRLAKKGANLHALDRRGNSALMYGVYSSELRYEMNWLHDSVDSGNYPLVWLLQQGLNPNQQNVDGQTALMRAAKKNDRNGVEVLMSYKADVSLVDKNGLAALQYAAANGIAIEPFIVPGIDINAPDRKGDTALHHVVYHYCRNGGAADETPSRNKQYRYKQEVVMLLEKGADPMIENKKKESPLSYSRLQQRTDLVKIISAFVSK